MNYAYAGLHRLYQKMDRRTIWDQLERRGEEKPKQPARRAEPKRSFVKQW
jgi:hypothetical protein